MSTLSDLVPVAVSVLAGAIGGYFTSAIRTEVRLTRLETLVEEIREDVKLLLTRVIHVEK